MLFSKNAAPWGSVFVGSHAGTGCLPHAGENWLAGFSGDVRGDEVGVEMRDRCAGMDCVAEANIKCPSGDISFFRFGLSES